MTRKRLAVLATAFAAISTFAAAQGARPQTPAPASDPGPVKAPMVPSSVSPDAPGWRSIRRRS